MFLVSLSSLFYKSRTVGVYQNIHKSVQYESVRIVTGLRKGIARVKLYSELGWDFLQNRRKKQTSFSGKYCFKEWVFIYLHMDGLIYNKC
jgi:hypothetical protein